MIQKQNLGKEKKEEFKLKKQRLYGELAVDVDIDLKLFIQPYGIALSTLKKWRTDYIASIQNDKIDSMVKEHVNDDTTLEEITDWVAGKHIVDIEPRPELLIPEIEPAEQTQLEVIQADAAALFVDRVGGLVTLKAVCQAAAGDIVLEIIDQIKDIKTMEYGAKELMMLTNALTSIQDKFFNKEITQINVNTQNNTVESGLNTFLDKLKA